jgi:hypothetical protein
MAYSGFSVDRSVDHKFMVLSIAHYPGRIKTSGKVQGSETWLIKKSKDIRDVTGISLHVETLHLIPGFPSKGNGLFVKHRSPRQARLQRIQTTTDQGTDLVNAASSVFTQKRTGCPPFLTPVFVVLGHSLTDSALHLLGQGFHMEKNAQAFKGADINTPCSRTAKGASWATNGLFHQGKKPFMKLFIDGICFFKKILHSFHSLSPAMGPSP